MKKFLKSLLIIFATMCALPAFADDPCRNLFDKNDVVIGELNRTNGIVTSSATNYVTSDYIEVDAGADYTLSVTTDATGNTGRNMVFYDSNKNYISGVGSFIFTQVPSTKSGTFTVPNGVKYVRFSPLRYDDTDIQLERGSTATTYQPYNPLCATCDGTVVESKNLVDMSNPQNNKTMNDSGELNSINNFTTSRLLPILPSTSYIYSLQENHSEGGFFSRVAIYDSNGNFIELGAKIGITQETTYSQAFTTPANAAYFRVSYRNTCDNVQLEEGSTATPYHPYGTTYCEPFIKIATTAYNAAAFAPVEQALESAVTTIKDVVANTIVQADAIQNLQDTKQTMPDASGTNGTCPRFRQCLLIETDDGTPQWFQIADPVYDLISSLKNNKVNSSGETTSTAFAANGYDGTNNTTDSRYYNGYPAMRLKTSAASGEVYTRQFSSTLLNGANGGQYKTLGDQEWAVTWDGNETGTADSFLPGVIYGTSRCAKTRPSSTAPGTDGWTTIENSDALNDLENIEQYMSCFCKITGVGLDGMITPVKSSSAAPWVFYSPFGSAGYCARDCAYYCANTVRDYASFRNYVMGWAVE